MYLPRPSAAPDGPPTAPSNLVAGPAADGAASAGADAAPPSSSIWTATIETPRLVLRYLCAGDVLPLMPILSDAAVTRFLPYVAWTGIEEGRAWCAEFAESNRVGSTAWFVCIEKGSGTVIGNCVLFDRAPAAARAELGYMIGRPWWRQGYAVEAATAVIDHGFRRCGLERLEAQVHVDNIASQNLAMKLGFQREGLLRKRLVNNEGVLHDVVMFGLLRDEFLRQGSSATSGRQG